MTASRISVAPLGEPGRVMMRLDLRRPATGRAIMPTVRRVSEGLHHGRRQDVHGVIAREAPSIKCLGDVQYPGEDIGVSIRETYIRPGACLCINGDTAWLYN
jgi:hypothetical protein